MTTLVHYYSIFEAIILFPFAMLLYGLLTNFGRKVIAAKSHKTGKSPSIAEYWKAHPMQSVLSLLGAVVGYALFVPSIAELSHHVGTDPLWNMARMTAFGIGYMADSIADAIGEQTLRSIPALATRKKE